MKPSFKSFEDLNKYVKYGVIPEYHKPKKLPHKGGYSLYYGKQCLLENKLYCECMVMLKECRMKGREYPDKSKFKIKPHK